MAQLASSVAGGLDVGLPRHRKRRWPSTETASATGSPRNNSSITPDHTVDSHSPVTQIPASLLSSIVSSVGSSGVNVHPTQHLREQQLQHQAHLQHQAQLQHLQQQQQHPHHQQQQQHHQLHQSSTAAANTPSNTAPQLSSASGPGSGERGTGNGGGSSASGSSSAAAPFIHPAPIEAMTIGAMSLPNHPDDMEIKPGIAEMIREEERVSFLKISILYLIYTAIFPVMLC